MKILERTGNNIYRYNDKKCSKEFVRIFKKNARIWNPEAAT